MKLMTNSSKKKYVGVALLMAVVIAASLVITQFTGVARRDDDRLRVVATFYPVYVAALQVTDGVEDCNVVNLTPAHTGCLHDYQLTPDNMITLTGADVLVINGAGAESFLDSAIKQYPDLPVVDTSAGIALEKSSHHHEHEDEVEEDDHDEEFYNEHIWTSPDRYIQQVENLRDGLIKVDAAHADKYTSNAAAYIAAIKEVKQQLKAAADALPSKACITFHDSLTYFAEDLGLQPVAALSMGEESGVSAAEMTEAAQAAAKAKNILLLYDDQYDVEYTSVASQAQSSRILKLDTVVSEKAAAAGSAVKDAWLTAMRANVEQLRGTQS